MTEEDRSHAPGPSNPTPILARSILRAAVVATEASRAYVVEDGRRGPIVVLTHGDAPRDPARPSRSVLRAAIAANRPRFWARPFERSPFGAVDSVLRLDVGAFAFAPLPGIGARRRALVLDWRCPAPGEIRRRLPDVLSSLAVALDAGLANDGTPETTGPTVGDGLVGDAPRFVAAIRAADRAATCDLPVVIEGETGTGKEAIAHRIHRAGRRATGPFVAINCAAVPESLIEAELFGAVRGSYTGADRTRPGLMRAAHGGTVFLDEIGDMPRSMQAKLLRVLQERRVRPLGGHDDLPVDARVIAATHRSLPAEVAAGRFRADLYHRVAVLRVRLPALRERPEDMRVLADHLLGRLHREERLPRPEIAPSAVARLARHAWPGNVRELAAVLARAALGCRGRTVRAADLEFDAPATGASPAVLVDAPSGEPLEAVMIRVALAREGGRVTAAARRIGWTRQKLGRRMDALDVPR